MQAKLSQIPFVRLLVPFATGIITELYFPSHSLFLSAALLFLCVALLWNWKEKRKGASYSLRWINGALVAACLFACGYATTLLHTPAENKTYVGNITQGGRDSMLVTLSSIPQEKEKIFKAIGEITGIIKNGLLIKSTGKALFYFHKDSTSGKLNYGEELLIYSQLQTIEPPSNPDEFDYKQFLQTRGIAYECFVIPYSYSVTGTNGSNALLHFANNSRKKLTALLHEKIGGNEADIASAILLGYRDELSPSVIQNFVDSGVVHVICVAGLHVGILFLILSYIIAFPSRFKYCKVTSVTLILILLWLYALITGLATPVLRASIMFSFLTIGRHLRKYTNPVNTLAASAFLMLLFSPSSVGDTSFQLSYFAVLGILMLYKPILTLFNPEPLFVRKIWELICVSVSAQLAVFPLSLLYFHQFPNYFIVANILVVPLLAIVICLGIIFFITSSIPILSIYMTWLLQKSLLLMNAVVSGISHLPYSTSKGISISSFEAIILFLFILTIIFFFSSLKKHYFIGGLSILAIFTGIRTVEKTIHSRQQVITIYNVPGKSAVSFISGEHSLMPFSNIDSADIAWHIQYNWWKLGVNDNIRIPSDTNALLLSGRLLLQQQFAQFNNYRIAFIKQNTDLSSSAGKLNLHCLVISNGYSLDILSLKNAFNFDAIIFDSSIPEYKLKNWEAECKLLNLHYYSVREQGAFIENC